MFEIIVIGGGPAGLMASISAANYTKNILVVESGNKCGKKLLSTGGGRCNFTHLYPMDDLINKYGKNRNFIKSALYELPPPKVVSFFKEIGIESFTDEKNCVFPESNRASDILNALLKNARHKGISFSMDSRVEQIKLKNNIFEIKTKTSILKSKKVIIATGGLSYPETGSTGDGYNFAEEFGHNIIKAKPGLVPLVIKNHIFKSIAGVSIPNVEITFKSGKKNQYFFGDILFTHSGISGPVVYDLSSELCDELIMGTIEIYLDFITNNTLEELERFIMHSIIIHPHKKIKSLFTSMLPQSLVETILKTNTLDLDLQLKYITGPVRKLLLEQFKSFKMQITGALPIEQAIVTIGGICTKEINKNSMESKLIKNLFFAGEVIDVDGKCGGYNLQMCWATGYLAGKAAAKKTEGE